MVKNIFVVVKLLIRPHSGGGTGVWPLGSVFPTPTIPPQMQDSNKPVHEIRMGNVMATIWLKQNSDIIRHNVTFRRMYKDGDKWKYTESFGREDLPKIGLLAPKVYEWMFTSSAAE